MTPLTFPSIDPVLFSMGPLSVRWYGVMYVLGFAASYFLVKRQIRHSGGYKELGTHFENLNLVLILCVILGGRLGYVLFYNLSYYLARPMEIPATWAGGMSFHGACLGLIAGGLLFCRRTGLDFWKTADIYAVTLPVGLGLGRVGNFINGELYGRVSDMPWAVVFPYGGNLARHPSQLYEAALEGVVLFCILWPQRQRPSAGRGGWPHGSLLALFLIAYGVCRFFVEFFREPDPQLGRLMRFFSMGQILSFFMIVGGIVLWRARRSRGSSAKHPSGEQRGALKNQIVRSKSRRGKNCAAGFGDTIFSATSQAKISGKRRHPISEDIR